MDIRLLVDYKVDYVVYVELNGFLISNEMIILSFSSDWFSKNDWGVYPRSTFRSTRQFCIAGARIENLCYFLFNKRLF